MVTGERTVLRRWNRAPTRAHCPIRAIGRSGRIKPGGQRAFAAIMVVGGVERGRDMGILTLLNGYKTYIAALGLVGLAIYQISVGEYNMALQSILAGLAAAGLRSDMAKVNS